VAFSLDDLPIEPPFSRAQIEAQIAAQPEAAQVLFDLLPMIEDLSTEVALVAESSAYGLLQGSAAYQIWLSGRKPVSKLAPGQLDMMRDGDILSLCINRPHALNAIDRDMRDALREGFDVASLDPDVRTVRLTGEGKAFCTGGDLAEFGTTRDPEAAHLIRMQTLPAHAIIHCAHKMEVHVQGACIGAGLEMAAFAQLVTATRKAWFHLPELEMGLIPGAGGCVSVSHRIGWQRTALLVLSGKRIGAEQALGWGLIDAIVDD
jgi:hypothetical protein